MSETFTASNGVKVEPTGDEDHFNRFNVGANVGVLFTDAEFDALREFLQHERDAELGRWRWPDDPDFVVYAWTTDPPRRDVRGVTVLSEAIPRGYTVWEDRADAPPYGTSSDEAARRRAREAARAYFDAHPEPKPWYDAQHDEIWLLTTPAMGERPYQVVRTEDAGFRFFLIADTEGFRPGLFPEEHQITAGRRVWPEGD